MDDNKIINWHPDLTEEQILYAQNKGINMPYGLEYEQFLRELGIDSNKQINDTIENIEETRRKQQLAPRFIDDVYDEVYLKPWHPDLTKEQILYALSKSINEPIGDEYKQFLMELGLDPIDTVKNDNIFVDNIIIPGGQTITTGGSTNIPGGQTMTTGGSMNIPGGQTMTTGGSTNIPRGQTMTTGSSTKTPRRQTISDIHKGTVRDYQIALEKELTEDTKSTTVRIDKKIKNRLSKWLLILAAITPLITGIKISENIIDREVTKEVDIHNVEYEFKEIQDVDKLAWQIASNLSMGDNVELKDGQTFYVDSRLTGVNKTIGKEFDKENKFEGEYAITGFSVVKDGEIIDYIENFDNNPMDKKLGDFVQEVLVKHNLQFEEIDVRLHFGSNPDITRLGWADSKDVVKKMFTNDQIMKTAKYSGEVIDPGDTITLSTDHGEVKIPIKDNMGNYYKDGTRVKGSDGQEYIISSLNVEKETKVSTTKEKIVDGIKITYNIFDCSLLASLVPLIGSAMFAQYIRNENKEASKKPYFHSFEDEETYSVFRKDFIKARETYRRKTSKFFRIFVKEDVHEMRVLNEEQIEELKKLTDKQLRKIYSKINDGKYEYNPNDKVVIKGGRLLLINSFGETYDITDFIIEEINNIGKNNEIVERGFLSDELDINLKNEGKSR